MNTQMYCKEQLKKSEQHAENIYFMTEGSKIVPDLMDMYATSEFIWRTINTDRANEGMETVILEDITQIVNIAERVNNATKKLLYEAIRLQNEYCKFMDEWEALADE